MGKARSDATCVKAEGKKLAPQLAKPASKGGREEEKGHHKGADENAEEHARRGANWPMKLATSGMTGACKCPRLHVFKVIAKNREAKTPRGRAQRLILNRNYPEDVLRTKKGN